ncbi:NAD(P)-dependent oxidoreductase [Natronomonas gomsonensis]|uniref:NAD(P)-dependent oxidoreductase n=1 Tax=Natronomonas gomsonensis TaxID=1046043 RepID=UPI0020CA8B97|nr:NAD(P)-dependent oxidoreductase [Natronomonas gomsonensis]MCY4729942.1 NAD(P)-dependent oxidoreductase [Natronomonas gomsonensis]
MLERPVSETSIGFVGLGTMGMPMAKNAIKAGFDVTGFDLREEILAAFVEAGGDRTDSLAALATECAIVSVIVQDDDQVKNVVAGPDGVFDHCGDETLVLIHSTIHPETPEQLAETAPGNVTVLDAPVSGTRTRAESADLAFMVGGDEQALDYVRPYLDSMGANVHAMGDVGSGEVAKIANNLVGISNMMTTAEGVALGTEWGLDQKDLLAVMAESSADSFVLENWEWLTDGWDDVQPGGWDGVAHICQKDLLLALDLAESVDLPVPGTAVASQEVPAFFRGLTDEG